MPNQPTPPPQIIYARHFPKTDRWFFWHAGEFETVQHRDADIRYVPVATVANEERSEIDREFQLMEAAYYAFWHLSGDPQYDKATARDKLAKALARVKEELKKETEERHG